TLTEDEKAYLFSLLGITSDSSEEDTQQAEEWLAGLIGTDEPEEVPEEAPGEDTKEGLIEDLEKTDDAPSYEEGIIKDTVGDYKQAEAADMLLVKHTFVDKSLMPEGRYTFEALFEDADGDGVSDNVAALLGQTSAYVSLYAMEDDPSYLVGRVDTMNSAGAVLTDYDIAYNNNSGTLIDDCIYDPSTGLIYVPVSYHELGTGAVQMQLLYAADRASEELTTTFTVNIRDTDNGEAYSGSVKADIYKDQVVIDLSYEGNVPAKYLTKVTVNGTETVQYNYDKETGLLTIGNVSPSSVEVVEAFFSAKDNGAKGIFKPAETQTYDFSGGKKMSVAGSNIVGAHTVFSGQVMYYQYAGSGAYTGKGLYGTSADTITEQGAAALINAVNAALKGGTSVSTSDLVYWSGTGYDYWNVRIPKGSYTFTNPSDKSKVDITIPEDIQTPLKCTHVAVMANGAGDNELFNSAYSGTYWMPVDTAVYEYDTIWGYVNPTLPYDQIWALNDDNPAVASGKISAADRDASGYQWYNAPVSVSVVAVDTTQHVAYLSIATATAGSQSGSGILAVPFEEKPGYITLTKKTNPASAINDHSVEGAVYLVCTSATAGYKSGGYWYGFVTGANGTGYAARCSTGSNWRLRESWQKYGGTAVEVPKGEYYVKEIIAPTNGAYALDTNLYTASVNSGVTTPVTSTEKLSTVPLYLKKSSQASEWCTGNSLYSLEGA
ncbi:MAG: hypothetical protein HUJ76_11360, partial [Parasporobacterium sp.]|nr:hypothetical protein [Parasporobacterium sp.]